MDGEQVFIETLNIRKGEKMKNMMVCVFIIGLVFAYADVVEGTIDGTIHSSESIKISGVEYDCPDGIMYRQTPAPVDVSKLKNIDDPTSYRTLAPRPIHLQHEERGDNWYDWDNDVLVYNGEVGENQDWDYDAATGDIYAIVDTYHSTNDSIVVYRSTNGGDSFEFWRASVNTDGEVGNPKIRIMQDTAGQVWVCVFGIWYETTGEQILWMRRMTPDQSQSAWEQVTTVDVDWADADATVGTSGRLYCTYIPTGTNDDIWAVYNDCEGSGWASDQQLFVDPGIFPYPRIACFGPVGNVGVAFVDDRVTTNNEVRIKRSTDGGVSWAGSQQVSNNSGAAPLNGTDIAYGYPTAVGWIFVTFAWATGDNCGYYYTTNSGVAWTYGAVIGSGDDENNPSVRCRQSSGSVTLAYNQDPGDSVMFSWTTTGDPTGFISPYKINDYAATGIWPPTAGWNGGNSGIMYSNVGDYHLYFDWFSNTAVEENGQEIPGFGVVTMAPNPATTISRLSYTLPIDQHVTISVYDATGSLVRNIVDETQNAGVHTATVNTQKLAAGIYFVRIETETTTSSTSVTVIK
jgi:hypothetical protein